MSKSQIILLIAAFLTLTLGSFIWFIVTWDAEKEQPIGMHAPAPQHIVIISPKILSPQAIPTSERATT